jgi:hypothetical protein
MTILQTMNKNLYINGFLLIFKIHFHNIRGTPSRLLRCTVWESMLYSSGIQPGVREGILGGT